jgi:Reverse transcriptase (RNA-dependent DNA polymerase)
MLSRRFGIDGSALVWYKAYLADRTQTFQLGAQQSRPHVVDCSVPQGSVLGPQRFIAYTDDMVVRSIAMSSAVIFPQMVHR